MDLDLVVARWALAHWDGTLDGPDLLAAVRDLGTQLGGRDREQDRVAWLVTQLEDAVADADAGVAVEAVVTRFLGRPPSEVVAARPAPDWS